MRLFLKHDLLRILLRSDAPPLMYALKSSSLQLILRLTET